jgi:hypothetical protein
MFDFLTRIGLPWEKVAPAWLRGTSRLIHNAIWKDMDQDLCSRAVWKGWKRWIRTFGVEHCVDSFLHYHGKKKSR